ncbi:DUF4307 domain-containing protein [uncultured Pseudokineococcus sp.]|uniref:DUF4307 domain-containing protein n=1 Tax=uncultured Pseudokineococcus sp. TaxID=1642928 RepID=UPI0026123D5F|nr:DUF4307 domain-containing protein [uncultured Pseudokineococcus sp.]
MDEEPFWTTRAALRCSPPPSRAGAARDGTTTEAGTAVASTAGSGGAGSRTARLDERYGRRAPSPRRRRARVLVAAVGGAAVLAWAAWAGPALLLGEGVSTQVVGFSAPTATAVELDFQVTMDPGRTARCDLRALAEDFTTVGWQTVDVGPSDGDVVRRSVEIRTQQPAVSAEVMGCELLADG